MAHDDDVIRHQPSVFDDLFAGYAVSTGGGHWSLMDDWSLNGISDELFRAEILSVVEPLWHMLPSARWCSRHQFDTQNKNSRQLHTIMKSHSDNASRNCSRFPSVSPLCALVAFHFGKVQNKRCRVPVDCQTGCVGECVCICRSNNAQWYSFSDFAR